MAMDTGPRGIRLRPLEIGDVLDETFQVYRRNFVPLITAMAIVVVPSSLLSLIGTLITGVGQAGLFDRLSPEASLAVLGAGIAAALVFVVLAVVAGLAHLVAAGAVVRIASNAVLGQPYSIQDAYREAFGRFGSLLLVSICVSIVLMLLVVTCIGIPVAVFVGLGWSVVLQAIMLEGHGAIDAMRRSWALVGGHRWRLLVCYFLIGLIVWLLLSIPTGIFTFVGLGVATASGGSGIAVMLVQIGQVIFQAAGQVLFGAIGYITATLIYYDLRVRKEAFDLQQRLPADPGYPQQYAPGYPAQYPPQYPQAPQQPPQYPQQPPQYPPQYPQFPPQAPPPPGPDSPPPAPPDR